MKMNRVITKTFIKSVLVGAAFAIAYFVWQAFFMKWDMLVTAISAGALFLIVFVLSVAMAIKAFHEKEAYIFDMDGTLVDSVYALDNGTKGFLDEMGVKYPDNIVEIITPLGYEGAAKYIQSLGVDKTVDELMQMMKNAMIGEYENNIPAKPFAIDVIKRLHREGHTLCVLTASPHFLLDPCFKRLGIYDLFDKIWSTDDFGLTKSDKRIYHSAAKIICKPVSECVFVDDNINNIRTAKEAGMHTIGVYDSTSENSQTEIKNTAERYIISFDEF